MAAAESLYGVTMQEPGVSRLVSVRLQPAPEERTEAEAVAV
jgi:chromosome segregation ATPase